MAELRIPSDRGGLELILAGFPRYKQDVISLREACQGCGRDHAVCNSYTDILLYGRSYDLDTFVSDEVSCRRLYKYCTPTRKGVAPRSAG
jgi:hypothetical protein